MNWLRNKKTIVTHSGRFHADDVFAIATLRMLPEWKSAKLIRTRDEEIIKKADLVVDVGAVYDPAQNRFDHHQTGGAGKYENGIPYSGFGLIWKQFGEQICGSKEVARMITEKLVQPIDAMDCGVLFYQFNIPNFAEYVMDDMVDSFNPSWKEENYDRDRAFNEASKIAGRVLEREIKKMQDKLEAQVLVDKAYQATADKKIIVLDQYLPGQEILANYPEPIFVIHPHTVPGTWAVKTIIAEKGTFKTRKDLPKAWAGKRGEELAKLSGVADAHFCHNALYICVARSKEGAIKMAQLALAENN